VNVSLANSQSSRLLCPICSACLGVKSVLSSAINFPSVAICIGVALEPHAKNFILPEVARCGNDYLAQGCPLRVEREVIESVPHNLHIKRNLVDQRRNAAELSPVKSL
jgi:hypothetical protein